MEPKLEKGTSVTFRFKLLRDNFNEFMYVNKLTKDTTKLLSNNIVSIEGFISGDDEKGLSIVALDNPQCCLALIKEDQEIYRNIIRKTKTLTEEDVFGKYRTIGDISIFASNPVCPY